MSVLTAIFVCEAGHGMLPPVARAEQSDRSPHQISDGGDVHPSFVDTTREPPRDDLSIRLQPPGGCRLLHRGSSPGAEHQSLEQGVAGETIGAMDAGARNLSRRKKP